MLRLAVLVAMLSFAVDASGSVLCAKPRRDGTFNGTVKVRDACTPREVQLAPGDVGFCCGVTTTVTVTTTCPSFTTTTLGIPDCGGTAPGCGGLCANARECVDDGTGACACVGAELPCGVVSVGGACGGTCPAGFGCALFSPTGPNGCPDVPRCGCIPGP